MGTHTFLVRAASQIRSRSHSFGCFCGNALCRVRGLGLIRDFRVRSWFSESRADGPPFVFRGAVSALCIAMALPSPKSMFAGVLAMSLLILHPAYAQCAPQWASAGGAAGVSGVVYAMTSWDPDGAGPATERIVLGGSFRSAGEQLAANIVAWDPSTGAFSPLGRGFDNFVFALAVLADGSLVAGGNFTADGNGGGGYRRIARWTGTTWVNLGSGVDAAVRALAVMPNGDLIAGGDFLSSGGTAISRVARWNGISWSAMGVGFAGPCNALCSTVGGSLYAGGNFTGRVMRWTGAAWAALGTGIPSGSVNALATLPSGQLAVGGSFTSAGGLAVANLAKWNGTAWSVWTSGNGGTGISGASATASVDAIQVAPNGDIYFTGAFTNAGTTAVAGMARWDGTFFQPVGSGISGQGLSARGHSIGITASGSVLVGGSFTVAGGLSVEGVARWSGSAWSRLSSGFNGIVSDACAIPGGGLLVVGSFTGCPGGNAARIAKWNGSAWTSLGSGLNGSCYAVTALPNGDVIAGGEFTNAGGAATARVARWNGSSWNPMGSGVNGPVSSLVPLPSGEVVVGGAFSTAGGQPAANIAVWTGVTWRTLGSGLNAEVRSLAVDAAGNIYASGYFTAASSVPVSRVARWNGSNWSALGTGLNDAAQCLVAMPGGRIAAGGYFTVAGGLTANRLAIWNGQAWSSPATGLEAYIGGLAVAPRGDLFVAGSSSQGDPNLIDLPLLSRWNGTSWSAVAATSDVPFDGITPMSSGGMFVFGGFSSVGGLSSRMAAFLLPTCPASISETGVGCSGSAGLLQVSSSGALPWLGATMRTTTTGFAPGSFGFALVALQPTAIPLSSLHPSGLPGCNLWNAGDVMTQFLFASSGIAPFPLSLPNDPFLAGVALQLQIASVELDAARNIASIASSNGLELTLGFF